MDVPKCAAHTATIVGSCLILANVSKTIINHPFFSWVYNGLYHFIPIKIVKALGMVDPLALLRSFVFKVFTLQKYPESPRWVRTARSCGQSHLDDLVIISFHISKTAKHKWTKPHNHKGQEFQAIRNSDGMYWICSGSIQFWANKVGEFEKGMGFTVPLLSLTIWLWLTWPWKTPYKWRF